MSRKVLRSSIIVVPAYIGIVVLVLSIGAHRGAVGSGSLSITKVVGFGDPAPIGGTFTRFTSLDINDQGHIGFAACAGSPSCGFFASSGGSISTLVRRGDPVPGGGTLSGDCGGEFGNGDPLFNDADDAAFFSLINAHYIDNSCVSDAVGDYIVSGGALIKVVQSGDPSPVGGNFTLNLNPPSLNDVGKIAFTARLDSPCCSQYGLFLGSQSGITELASLGSNDPAPGGGTFSGVSGRVSLNDLDQVAFTAVVTLNGVARQGLYLADGGTVQRLVQQGDPAPGGGTFRGVASRVLNDLGEVMFSADINVGTSVTDGIFLYSGGAITKVVRRGDPAPGGGTFVDYSLGSFSLNDVGQAVFIGAVDFGDGLRHQGLFLLAGGTITKILGGSDPIPGGTLRPCFGSVDLNNSGQLAFMSADCVVGGYIDIYVASGVGGPPPPPPTPTPSPPPSPAILVYVAAGDSVPDGEDLGGCPTGTNCREKAYPRLFADRLVQAVSPDIRVELRNVACSGFTTTQFRSLTSCRGSAYPHGTQLDEIQLDEGDVKVITITVGADNLLALLEDTRNIGCLTPIPKDPKKCESRVAAALQVVRDDLVTILRGVNEHADLIIVTGYYPVYEVPADPNRGFIRRKVNGYIERLNSVIWDVTNLDGIKTVYADLGPTFAGHSFPCRSGEGCPTASLWLAKRIDCEGLPDYRDFKNDAQLFFAIVLAKGDPQKVGCLLMPGVHPNDTGQVQISDLLWGEVGDAFQP